MVTIILSEMGSLFYIHKAIIPNILANSSRIDARTGEMKPGKVNLYIYASIISSETILKLPHDIKKLFVKLKEYAKSNDVITRRLHDLEVNIPQIILDLISLDNTGETYRYRRNINNENHLDGQVRHINIRSIYLGYCKFWEEVDNFLCFLDQLRIDKRNNES
jgi:hypothetical protein